MWLPARLRAVLGSLETAQKLVADVGELRASVEALEALQLAREGQWTEAKDQIYRHLKRIQAVKQYELQDEEPATRPSAATVLGIKYGKGG